MKRICFAAVMCVVAVCLAVDLEASSSFVIERIEVRGVRFVPPRVIARETMLKPGSSCEKKDVDDALARVNRLPFVLEAEGSLESGKDEGAYVFVVSVVETMPVSLGAWSETRDFDSSDRYTLDGARAGGRWFFDSGTLVHVATDSNHEHEAGVTQYGLFGRPGYVSLVARWDDLNRTAQLSGQGRIKFESDPWLQLRVEVPLFGNHSIRGSWLRHTSGIRTELEESVEDLRQESNDAELGWFFDTTDDVLPTRGTIWRTGVTINRLDNDLGPGPIESQRTSVNSVGTAYVRYQPLSDRFSVMFGGSTGLTKWSMRSPHPAPSSTTYGVRGEGGFIAALWPEHFTRRFGDLRWENHASYGIWRGDGIESHNREATTSIVQRGIWSTLRLSFAYFSSDIH